MGYYDDLPVMTAAQAGSYLGIGHGQIIALIKDGTIPALNVSKARRPVWRVRREDLDALFVTQKSDEK